MYNKLSRPRVYVPIIQAIFFFYLACSFINPVIVEEKYRFSLGQVPMYFIIAIFIAVSIAMVALAIINYRNINRSIKEYTKEEREKIFVIDIKNDSLLFKLVFLLPIAIITTLLGFYITYFSIVNYSDDSLLLMFIVFGIIFILLGIIIFAKLMKKE